MTNYSLISVIILIILIIMIWLTIESAPKLIWGKNE